MSYKGGEDYFYRLRIGDFPCATTPLPLAIKRGAKATVRLRRADGGRRRPRGSRRPRPTRRCRRCGWRRAAPTGCTAGRSAWPCPTSTRRWSRSRTTTRPTPTASPCPAPITGRFEQKGDVDVYRVRRQEGDALRHRRPDARAGFADRSLHDAARRQERPAPGHRPHERSAFGLHAHGGRRLLSHRRAPAILGGAGRGLSRHGRPVSAGL